MIHKDLELEKKILNLKKTSNNSTDFFAKLKNADNKALYDEIVRFTPLLDGKNLAFRTRVYWYLNGISEFPLCEVCKTPLDKVNVKNLKDGYPATCSRECSYASKSRSKCIHEVLMSRTSEQKAQTQEKTIATCRKKYGTDYSFQSENNKKKSEQTSMKKYGVKTPGTSKESRRKALMTVRKKYGVDNVFQAECCKKKAQKTWVQKYGVDHPMKCEDIKNRAIETCKETKRNQSWDIISNDKLSKPLFSKEFFLEHFSNDFQYEFECSKCGNHFMSNYANGVIVKHCPLCFPKTSSVAERLICQHLQDSLPQGTEIIQNSKSIIGPFELDIFIPERNLAIEFDGLYWHSFQNLSKSKGSIDYHLKKTLMCEQKGIHLIHIFEDEWEFKRDLVISTLDRILDINIKHVQASSCKIEQISKDETKEFLKQNSLLNSGSFDIAFGLIYNNDILYVSTFQINRESLEMIDTCFKIGFKVIGAEESAIHEAMRYSNISSVTHYLDRRLQDKADYQSIGFKAERVLDPDFEYITPDHIRRIRKENIWSKVDVQKLKTQNKHANVHEILLANGYEMIYNCGKLVMRLQT